MFEEETETLDVINALIESDKLLICSSVLDLYFSEVSTISLNDDTYCPNCAINGAKLPLLPLEAPVSPSPKKPILVNEESHSSSCM